VRRGVLGRQSRGLELVLAQQDVAVDQNLAIAQPPEPDLANAIGGRDPRVHGS
jgi:hypothetical protein